MRKHLGTRKAKLLGTLYRRFPDQEAPFGTWSLMAEEFGMSESQVGEVARRRGFRLLAKDEYATVRDLKSLNTFLKSVVRTAVLPQEW